MLALIIISKNQVKHLEQILFKISGMTVKPDRIYLLQDRDSIDDVNHAKSIISKFKFDNLIHVINNDEPAYIGRPQMNYGEQHFLAGYCRNKCIDLAISDGCSEFIFIDGDCLPEGEIVSGYHKYLKKDNAIVLCGRRNDFQFKYHDQREYNQYENIFAEDFTIIRQEVAVLDSAVLWSCNIGMNIAAVQRLKCINKTLYGYDEVFSTWFSGTWGGEDGFLGVECFYDDEITLAGLGVQRSGITHIHHERPDKKYAHIQFIKRLKDIVSMHKYLLKNYSV